MVSKMNLLLLLVLLVLLLPCPCCVHVVCMHVGAGGRYVPWIGTPLAPGEEHDPVMSMTADMQGMFVLSLAVIAALCLCWKKQRL